MIAAGMSATTTEDQGGETQGRLQPAFFWAMLSRPAKRAGM